MKPYISEDERCPTCGNVMGEDPVTPYLNFRKCEACGEEGGYVTTVGDRIDEAKNLFDWRD